MYCDNSETVQTSQLLHTLISVILQLPFLGIELKELCCSLQAEPALMYDSVHVFVHGLAALDRSHLLRPTNLSCELEQPWDDGLSLYNYINSVRRTS